MWQTLEGWRWRSVGIHRWEEDSFRWEHKTRWWCSNGGQRQGHCNPWSEETYRWPASLEASRGNPILCGSRLGGVRNDEQRTMIPGWYWENHNPSTYWRDPCQSSMARNCPGGQQVLTGVSKAKADPEKTVTRIAMDGLLADILGLGCMGIKDFQPEIPQVSLICESMHWLLTCNILGHICRLKPDVFRITLHLFQQTDCLSINKVCDLAKNNASYQNSS